MEAVERRRAIAQRLAQADGPVSAAALAKAFSVSRQIIVGDVALLRAGGMEIFATPRGYILPGEPAALTRTVACVHSGGEMARELEIMVDQGFKWWMWWWSTLYTVSSPASCTCPPGMRCRNLYARYQKTRPSSSPTVRAGFTCTP